MLMRRLLGTTHCVLLGVPLPPQASPPGSCTSHALKLPLAG